MTQSIGLSQRNTWDFFQDLCPPPPKCPQNQSFANISQFTRPREKIVETKNVSREISYNIDYTRVSLCAPINLKLYSNWYKSRFLFFTHFSKKRWVLFYYWSQKLGSRVNFLDVLKYPEYENRTFRVLYTYYICTDFVIRTSLSVFDRLSWNLSIMCEYGWNCAK